ncbi:MAG TPA: hypothetical protein DCY88_20530 [Cyanobacteria bacterium UBA11372]|nr:hypothetical protein [Cyanobacteria bacterium UBA11372]
MQARLGKALSRLTNSGVPHTTAIRYIVSGCIGITTYRGNYQLAISQLAITNKANHSDATGFDIKSSHEQLAISHEQLAIIHYPLPIT